ncbi:MAG: DegV family protein [Oscillospiraceae bacterium]
MSNKPFSIITEITCDLPQSYLKQNKIITMPLTYTLDGVEYDGSYENSLTPHDFYEKLRSGIMAKTAQISPEGSMAFFEAEIEKGNDVLYIGFSSGLSGCYQSATIAKAELIEKYPNAKIICIDSRSASLGQGLLVDYAIKKTAEGLSIEEVAGAIEDTKLKLCHYFTVDDLNHLYRGGRVSKTAAVFGTMLGIKPVMHMDDEGKLIPIGKVRGRKASLDELVRKMGTKLGEYKNPYVFISHGDSLSDAKYVGEQVKKLYGIKPEIIDNVGPVIGSHSGPATIALFFIGTDRIEKRL